MCDMKLLPDHPQGFPEYCDGNYHYYNFGNRGNEFSISQRMFSKKCPDYDDSQEYWLQDHLKKEIDERKIEVEKIENQLENRFFIKSKAKTFKSFDPKFNNLQKEVNKIKVWINNPDKIIVICGPTGTGKTHLCSAIVNQTEIEYRKCRMISASKFYNLYREIAGYDYDPIYDDALDSIYNSAIVIIDDLGDEKQTETNVFNHGFKELLDEFKGKIVVTTNLTKHDMENIYGQKIVSRLHENSTWIVLKGKDYRKEARQ